MQIWRKIIVWLIILALIGGGAYYLFFYRQRPEKEEVPLLVKVERQDISQLISLSGSVALLNQVNVTAPITGKVTTIMVQVGDWVDKDQELLRLDVSELENQIALSRVNLEVAQLKLQQLKEGASASELEVLRVSLEKAQNDLLLARENLARSKQTVSLTASIAQTAISTAERRLTEAQENLELTKKSADQSIQSAQLQVDNAEETLDGDLPTEAARRQAEQALELAEENLEAVKISAEQRVTQAEAQVKAAEDALIQAEQGAEQRDASNRDLLAQAEAQVKAAELALKLAQAQYDQKTSPVSETTLSLQEKAVEQAEITLNNLLDQLSNSTIRAPVAGNVGQVNVRTGDAITPNLTLLNLIDTMALEITANVPEVNVGQLRPGMEAKVSVDAYRDRTFLASLSFIGPLPTVTQGVVNYVAHFSLKGETLELLRPGMSVEVEVTVAESKNALIVPRSALKLEGTDYFVQVWDGKELTPHKVEVGIINDVQVEIKEGLSESDEVSIGSQEQSATTRLTIPTFSTPSR